MPVPSGSARNNITGSLATTQEYTPSCTHKKHHMHRANTNTCESHQKSKEMNEKRHAGKTHRHIKRHIIAPRPKEG
jgi:hypothetical protein